MNANEESISHKLVYPALEISRKDGITIPSVSKMASLEELEKASPYHVSFSYPDTVIIDSDGNAYRITKAKIVTNRRFFFFKKYTAKLTLEPISVTLSEVKEGVIERLEYRVAHPYKYREKPADTIAAQQAVSHANDLKEIVAAINFWRCRKPE